MTRPGDTLARQRILKDLDATFVVEAAAGTGKTTALVGRILALITSGRARLAQVVAVTFTDKAAGEMKLRVRAGIEKARREADGQVRVRLEHALQELEIARIGTIHSFCADLLRERPVEAGVDPLFKVASESEARRHYDQAFDDWLFATLAAPPEAVRRILRRPVSSFTQSPTDMLRSAGYCLVQDRDFECPWRQAPFDRGAELGSLFEGLEALGALAAEAYQENDWLTKSLKELDLFVKDVRFEESLGGRDIDDLEGRLRQFRNQRPANKWTWSGRKRVQFGEGILRDDVLDRRDHLKQQYDDVIARADADLASKLRIDLLPIVDLYDALKTKAGTLDFLDLLLKTRALLMNDRTVREEFQRRFTHVLVDEVQDTDPLQADVVCLLAADDPSVGDPSEVRLKQGKVFLVGDPKQSIYRFRRADVAFYQALKHRLLQDGAELLHLSKSFRSDPRIQRLVNAAFGPRMQGGTQAEYVPLTPVRAEGTERPAVVALPVPEPYDDYGKVVKWKVDESLPHAVGAWLDWLFNASGWQVDDPIDKLRVPVAPRHVCLLFRRFQTFGRPVTQAFTEALEARGISHVLVGGRAFHEREEVIAFTNALSAIEWPEDEMSVFATLKGPFFAIPDDLLLLWRESHPEPGRKRRLHPLIPLEGEVTAELAPIKEALDILSTLHRARNRRPFADTVHAFSEATRAHAGLALWHGGEQALGNVLRVGQLARKVEAEGATSFRGLIEALRLEAERGYSPDAVVVEEGTEGVRIMTVHRAKGLEFPVVVLCDITALGTRSKPSRYSDSERRLLCQPLAGCVPWELLERKEEVLHRDAEEADRLLYVATTRARDVLVLPTVGDKPFSGWIEAMNAVLYPPLAQRRKAEEAPGCPDFGDDSVGLRPDRAPGPDSSVHPGTHHAREGVPVVWWDPKLLAARGSGSRGLGAHDLLRDTGLAKASIAAYDTWHERREARTVSAARPPRSVVNPTEKGGPTPPRAEVRWEETSSARHQRPHGKRFGALVHSILESAEVGDTEDRIARLVAVKVRLLGASPDEERAARDATVAALRHPLLKRASMSPDSRREAAVMIPLSETETVEGTVDLVFRDNGAWTVVEFKTTAEVDGCRSAYERQVAWYVHGVREATGAQVRGVILLV